GGITSIEGDLLIYNNASLSDCCGIFDLLNSGYIGGVVDIYNNKTGCDSESEIYYYCSDTDQDGISNEEDNCPYIANPGQEDLDTDGIGDVCDPVTEVGAAVTALSTDILALNLTEGVKTSLIAKLEAALARCAEGNTVAAVNQLGAFINEVEARRGNPLTNEEADELIAHANVLIEALQAGTVDCSEEESFQAPVGQFSVRAGLDGTLEMELFPNPAYHEVSVTWSGLDGDAILTIFNQTGCSIWQQPVNRDMPAIMVDLSAGVFTPGVYTLSLRSAKAVVSRRLVVVP
ncbi:MAG: hypothetical protein EP344_04345, partial [Bacteroidetes bacterium]